MSSKTVFRPVDNKECPLKRPMVVLLHTPTDGTGMISIRANGDSPAWSSSATVSDLDQVKMQLAWWWKGYGGTKYDGMLIQIEYNYYTGRKDAEKTYGSLVKLEILYPEGYSTLGVPSVHLQYGIIQPSDAVTPSTAADTKDRKSENSITREYASVEMVQTMMAEYTRKLDAAQTDIERLKKEMIAVSGRTGTASSGGAQSYPCITCKASGRISGSWKPSKCYDCGGSGFRYY